jgi:resolvase-like protein
MAAPLKQVYTATVQQSDSRRQKRSKEITPALSRSVYRCGGSGRLTAHSEIGPGNRRHRESAEIPREAQDSPSGMRPLAWSALRPDRTTYRYGDLTLRSRASVLIAAREIIRRDFELPFLARCFKTLQCGATLTVWELDRLGRRPRPDNEFDDLRARGVKFRSIMEGIDTTTLTGHAMWP